MGEPKYPPASKGTVIVWGLLASMPFGGMIWQVTHHLAGLRRLGFDVWYVEDSHNPCMHPETWEVTWTFDDTTRFLHETLASIGLQDRWVFRPPKHPNTCLGARDSNGLKALYDEAEVVFNLCGSHKIRDDHDHIKCLVLLQTDPVAPQLAADQGHQGMVRFLSRHDYLFTYGENIGTDRCGIPTAGFNWIPTRPPVIIDWWKNSGTGRSNKRLTTVAQWRNKGKNVEWHGRIYRWEKNIEYQEIIDLPKYSALPLELAVIGMSVKDYEVMTAHGWHVRSARGLNSAVAYRNYITTSCGEFSVAKEQNKHFRSGWFSDRSACYLAAGNPVVMQETGFGDIVPTGEGLFSFTSAREGAEAIAEVAGDLARHQKRAYEIAQEYFSAEKVLSDILRAVGLS